MKLFKVLNIDVFLCLLLGILSFFIVTISGIRINLATKRDRGIKSLGCTIIKHNNITIIRGNSNLGPSFNSMWK